MIWVISILLDAKYDCAVDIDGGGGEGRERVVGAVDMDGGGERGKRESRRWGFHMKLLYIYPRFTFRKVKGRDRF